MKSAARLHRIRSVGGVPGIAGAGRTIGAGGARLCVESTGPAGADVRQLRDHTADSIAHAIDGYFTTHVAGARTGGN